MKIADKNGEWYVNVGQFGFVDTESQTRFDPGVPTKARVTDWLKAQDKAGVIVRTDAEGTPLKLAGGVEPTQGVEIPTLPDTPASQTPPQHPNPDTKGLQGEVTKGGEQKPAQGDGKGVATNSTKA